ncbi:hypothetical protein QBC39DRAFT_328164 [Podospora conica]|nr:hypothetical protein QBC39DRAFT_328164 [Schizothecium conicum]
MKSAVVFTLAMGAAAMHIPWFSHNDDNKQTSMTMMSEEDAVMNMHHDKTRMPSGQGFDGMESGGADIEIHVHVGPSHQSANFRGHENVGGGMRTMSESLEQVDDSAMGPGSETMGPGSETMGPGSETMGGGDTMGLGSETMGPGSDTMGGDDTMGLGSDTMSPSSDMMSSEWTSSSDPQPKEMPGGEGMGGLYANPKGMQTTGSATGMQGHEECLMSQCNEGGVKCASPYYRKMVGECAYCCLQLSNNMGGEGSGSGMMMSRKKTGNSDL